MKKFKDEVRKEFQFLDYAEIAFVSAKEKQRLRTLFPYIKEASENHKSVFKVLHLMKLSLMLYQ